MSYFSSGVEYKNQIYWTISVYLITYKNDWILLIITDSINYLVFIEIVWITLEYKFE